MLAWAGVLDSLAGEREGGGGIIRDLERSIPLALAGAAQLRATGNDSYCLVINVVNGPSIKKYRRAGRDKTLVDLLWVGVKWRKGGERSGEEGEIYYYFSR